MDVTAYTLQSGYIGINNSTLSTSKPSSYTKLSIDSLLFTKPTESRFNDAKYSVAAGELMKRYLSDRKIIQNFDFVKDTFKTAKSCFTVGDIVTWLQLQTKCTFTSQIHVSFLEDTFMFIKEGKRMMSLTSWHNLITQTEEASKNPFKGNEYDKWMVNKVGNDLPLDIPSLLTRWVAQPAGIDDLVFTLAIIFSEKSHLKIR